MIGKQKKFTRLPMTGAQLAKHGTPPPDMYRWRIVRAFEEPGFGGGEPSAVVERVVAEGPEAMRTVRQRYYYTPDGHAALLEVFTAAGVFTDGDLLLETLVGREHYGEFVIDTSGNREVPKIKDLEPVDDGE